MLPIVAADRWYETVPMEDGITLVQEPAIKSFFRCNMWHIRGRDRDVLVDTGLGAVPLRARCCSKFRILS